MTDNILAYLIFTGDTRVRIEPSPRDRVWMDNTNGKYAYRCLPLTMANQHGWNVYPNEEISMVWDGRVDLDAIQIENNAGIASSIFGYGIVTFHIMHLIKTPENYNTWVCGPPNHVIPGIQALNGVVETDWAPFTFTMNWQLTHPGQRVTFTKNDPICHFFPIQRQAVEQFELVVDNLENNPVLHEQHTQFSNQRSNFYQTDEYKQGKWQKHYFQGKFPDGSKCPVDHQTKLNLRGPGPIKNNDDSDIDTGE